jgi:hypothetical protein
LKTVQRLAAVVAAAVVAACSGGGDGGSAAQVDGAIVKGPVTGATVCAFALSGGVKGRALPVQATGSGVVNGNGCFVTGADGAYAFTVPGYSGEVLLEAVGGSYCTDENPVSNGACTGGGAVVALNDTMTAVANVAGGSRSTTYVTPLTTAAVNAAIANGALTVETFRGRFTTLAGQVLGPNTTVTPSTPPTVATQPYLTQVAQHVRGGGTLSSAITSLQNGSTSFSGTSGTGTTAPTTVNAALVGTQALEFRKGSAPGCGTLCPYTEGGAVNVEIRADGTLMIGTLTLTNPFKRAFGGVFNEHEAIWLDAANGIEYALSDNAVGGKFNEINVFNARAATLTAGFLGQLRKPQPAADQLLQSMAGTFEKAYQYSGNAVDWTSITLAANGVVTFNGGAGGPSYTVAEIVSKTVQTYDGRVDILVNKNISGDSATDVDDVIRLWPNPNGGVSKIEYYKGASNVSTNQIGVAVGTVAELVHNGAAIPTASPTLKATIGTTALNLTQVTSAQYAASTLSFQITDGSVIFRMRVNAGGNNISLASYSCDSSLTGTTLEVFGIPNRDYRITQGGRCTIRFEQVTNGYKGTFVAEFGDDKRQTVQVLDGAFYIAP